VADAVSPTGSLGKGTRALEIEMIKAALDDAGLSLRRYTDNTNVGGSSFQVHAEHAAAAIATGQCEVAVSVYAATPTAGRAAAQASAPPRDSGGGSSSSRPRPMPMPVGGMGAGLSAWESAFGLRQPMGAYALAASRHMAQYGTTAEQLAQIAVSTRQWASMNPRARFQDPITIKDVLDSRYVCEPLHLLDCCLVTDGAGAFVMTSAERAKDLKRKPVYLLGAGTCHDHSSISAMPDLTRTAAAISGPKAFKGAGITHSDVDILMSYDSFTITVLMCLEDMGFCPKGEGGRFVADGKLGPGGALPTNTNGGGLSYTHPGMYGMFLMVEAARQLRGECGPRQVQGADIAVAHGSGGVLSTMSTIVLGTEATL
jgi:acetyl-CoA acetyltransferase